MNTNPNGNPNAKFDTARGVSYVEPVLKPIVQATTPGNPNSPLIIWTVVLGSDGAIIQDYVHQYGSPAFAIQQTNSALAPLYYDKDGNPTTDSTITGIPVILPAQSTDSGAQAVYLDPVGNQVFGSTNPDGSTRPRAYATDFTNGAPLYLDANGLLTTTVTSSPALIQVNRTTSTPWTQLVQVTSAVSPGNARRFRHRATPQDSANIIVARSTPPRSPLMRSQRSARTSARLFVTTAPRRPTLRPTSAASRSSIRIRSNRSSTRAASRC